MTNHVANLITASGILIFLNGEQYTVAPDHVNYGKIRDALQSKNYTDIPSLVDVVGTVRKWINAEKDFELNGDLIFLNGEPFSNAVTDKVLNMIEAGHNADPLFRFLRKVRLNPSRTAQEELLLFCVANGFMIHEDGDILAYKSVRGNYTDIHSGKFRNAVGDVVTMSRHTVDDRRDVTCSTGLHFASHEYASSWAGAIDSVNRRLMVMKINPADVVSIPNDYNNQKGRCARYEVIAELSSGKPLPKREVYTTRDVSIDRDRIQAEINRKQTLLENSRLELVNLDATLERIEELGGHGDDSQLEREDRLHQLIDNLETEIEQLENELSW